LAADLPKTVKRGCKDAGDAGLDERGEAVVFGYTQNSHLVCSRAGLLCRDSNCALLLNRRQAATASEYCECSDGSAVSCGAANACADERVYVEVDTSATFYTLTDWPGIPRSIALSGKAIMREQ
jgi:hypothetical protein